MDCQVQGEYGDKIAVDLAVRQIDGEWRTRGNGWVSDGGDLWEVLERLDSAGCTRFVVTDVSKDGTLTGPNVELLREVAMATDAKIVASGGISKLEDVTELALYENEGIDSQLSARLCMKAVSISRQRSKQWLRWNHCQKKPLLICWSPANDLTTRTGCHR